MPQRTLILANEFITDADRALPDHLRRQAGQTQEVLVIAPVLTTWLQSLASDIDGARTAAECRLRSIAADISKRHATPLTQIGDENQLLAATDALADFDADACVIVTHDHDNKNYHEHRVAEQIHDKFKLPTVALIVNSKGRLLSYQTL